MDRKTATILTAVTAVICGCPGLASLCFGSFFALAGATPGAEIDVFGSSDPSSALALGLGMACFGVLGVLVPIIVGFVTLRKKKAESSVFPEEPLPPTA
ncbi:MAG: hypothetical protein WHS87_00225 [Anaerolineales bacterium]